MIGSVMAEHSCDRRHLEISRGVAGAGTAAADPAAEAAASCPGSGGEAVVGAEGLGGVLA